MSGQRTAESDVIADLRERLAEGLCLCSSAHTDWRGVEDLLDRLERAEDRVRRVEGTIDAYQAAHSHLGIHRDQFGPSVSALKAALTLPPACMCVEGPYYGAQPADEPVRCLRCNLPAPVLSLPPGQFPGGAA